jgi:hypothetical protein
LSGIASKLALDHFRKHGPREVANDEIELEDQGPGPEAQLTSARARQLSLQALAMLPDRYRTILIKHDLDGIKLREICEETSMPLFTVAARLRRARLRFAKAVKQLQLKRDARWAVLAAPNLLEAERSLPPLPPAVRTRLRARLRPSAVAPAFHHIRHHFDGLVDEAVIHDRALSDAEVALACPTLMDLRARDTSGRTERYSDVFAEDLGDRGKRRLISGWRPQLLARPQPRS